MILDALKNSARYAALHPGLDAAFDYLRLVDWRALSVGRHVIDGDRLFILVEHPHGKGRDQAKLEAHRRYIDIQMCFSGNDVIGWKPAAACQRIDSPYNGERDILFFADAPDTWFDLTDSQFVVFYPDDAHAPLATTGPLKKAIVKVAVQW